MIAIFAEVVEKPFKATKFIVKSAKLIGYCISLVAIVYLLKKQRLKQNIFDRASLPGFTIREFRAKGDY